MPSKIWNVPFGYMGIGIAILGVILIGILDIRMWIIGAGTLLSGFMIAMIYFIFKPKFRHKVMLWVERANNIPQVIYDKAGHFRNEDGTSYYQFKSLGEITQDLSFTAVYSTSKGARSFFFSPAPGQFFPMMINRVKKTIHYTEKIPDRDNPGKFKMVSKEKDISQPELDIIPQNEKEWLVLKQTRQKQKYQTRSMFDMWYPLFVVVILGVVIVIMVSALFNSLTPYMDKLTKATDNLAAAAQTNAQVVIEMSKRFPINGSIVNGTITPNVPPDVVR